MLEMDLTFYVGIRGTPGQGPLEARGAPVHELDGGLGFDAAHGGVDILGDDVDAVHDCAGDVLAVVAFGGSILPSCSKARTR